MSTPNVRSLNAAYQLLATGNPDAEPSLKAYHLPDGSVAVGEAPAPLISREEYNLRRAHGCEILSREIPAHERSVYMAIMDACFAVNRDPDLNWSGVEAVTNNVIWKVAELLGKRLSLSPVICFGWLWDSYTAHKRGINCGA